MLKKILIVLETLLLIGAVAFGVWTYLQKVQVIADRDTLLTQNTQLQQSIDAIGPLTTVYTVKSTMIANNPVKEDDLIQMTIPASAVPADAITDLSQIVTVDPETKTPQKMYYKVSVNPQTMLTKDLLMTEDYTQPLYERDIYLQWLPIGLKANDAVDIKVSYPDGTELTVFPHKRIYMIMDNVVKVKFTYDELLRYTSLLTEYDYYQAQGVGIRIYAVAYIEPGLTAKKAPSVLYPVAAGVEAMIQRDPNVKNKNMLINTALREYLDTKMAIYCKDKEGFGIYSKSSMVASEKSALEKAADTYLDMFPVSDEDGEYPYKGDPTDLRGTGWDGELINGGQPYEPPTGTTTEGEAEGEGSNTIIGNVNNGGVGSVTPPTNVGNPIQQIDQATNDAANTLESVADQITETQPQVQPTEPEETNDYVDVQETQAAADSDGVQSNVSASDKAAAREEGNLFSGGDTLD